MNTIKSQLFVALNAHLLSAINVSTGIDRFLIALHHNARRLLAMSVVKVEKKLLFTARRRVSQFVANTFYCMYAGDL